MLDRRQKTRQLTLKTAKINALHVPSGIDCAVLDISEEGACILLPAGAEIPSSFDLAIDFSGERYVCTVAWRSGNKIGVSFRPPASD
jgi:PilZ domain